MTKTDLEQLAESRLSPGRYRHTLAVARLARELAVHYGADEEAAELAGLLHDLTKEESVPTQLQILTDSGIIYDDIFWASPSLYHAETGYLYARDVLGIRNEEVLSAVRVHTAGKAGMTLLEEILYVADGTAYDRTYAEAEELRVVAFRNLDACMARVVRRKIDWAAARGRPVLPNSLECCDWICMKIRQGSLPAGEGRI